MNYLLWRLCLALTTGWRLNCHNLPNQINNYCMLNFSFWLKLLLLVVRVQEHLFLTFRAWWSFSPTCRTVSRIIYDSLYTELHSFAWRYKNHNVNKTLNVLLGSTQFFPVVSGLGQNSSDQSIFKYHSFIKILEYFFGQT